MVRILKKQRVLMLCPCLQRKNLITQLTSLIILCGISLFVFLNSVFRPFQDYFSSYETGQSAVGGAKTGEPREKPPRHTRKQNLACLTCGESAARTHTRHGGEMIE